MKIKSVFLAFVVLFQLFCLSGCKECDTEIPSHCGPSIIVDSDLYQNAPDDTEEVDVAVAITGDCLELHINYGGGCGPEPEFLLIDSGIINSDLYRFVRLSVKDEDHCDAGIGKRLSFDLTPIRIRGKNKVELELAPWNYHLIYKY